MSITWQELRSFNGSQHAAFEELCCQLAVYEAPPAGASFVRKGAPDAGVECYWKLSDGSEWGWQAKFFSSPPDNGQWRQIDESVEMALEKHPRLSRYVVCLPIDRQDPRIEKQNWFMDKWNEHVEKWQEWARDRKMVVEYKYWGSHEIFERLSRDEHRGRYYFWFHRELFSQEWFRTRLNEAVANVGPRYSPELDISLPIAKFFHALGRTSEFYLHVKELQKKLKEAYSRIPSEPLSDSKTKIRETLEQIWELIAIMDHSDELLFVDWATIRALARTASELAQEYARTVSEAAKEKSRNTSTEAEKEDLSLREAESAYWHFTREARQFSEFAASNEAYLSNVPALLLVGEAGRGKTHLLCDVARHRIDSGAPTVLLLGGQFNLEEPWSQIRKLMGLSCTKEEFLGALEAAAQAQGKRAVVLIDALNEGQGKTLWKKHLAGILLTISNSEWLGIAVSVRTSYEDIIIPEGLVPDRLTRIEHRGFAEHEYQATKTFFNFFGIQQPSIPLLVPEFQNPLFLKIFCQGLKNSGLTAIPTGLQGISAIFVFFLDSVNKKLSDPEYIGFNPKTPIVSRAVEAFATRLAEEGKDWLPPEQAQELIDDVLPRNGYDKSLFRHLLSEGVISENRFYIGDNQWIEGVHFAYERFTDHLVAKYLLDKYLDVKNPASLFATETPLAKYVKDESACTYYRGLIEAFSIQLPERIGKELIELVTIIREFRSVVDAFIDSIVWREPKALNREVAIEYINAVVTRDSYHHRRLLDALLTVATNPGHPLNADFLHKNLMRFEMADRDASWSIFVHKQFGAHGAVDRLIDWAWSRESKDHISAEAVRLCGTALTWFLTTSNRFARDRATKALVTLFTNRLQILREMMQQFHGVNDPYVLERLFAVAYGCVLRSSDKNAIAEIAQATYDWIFRDGQPPVHILLRDYARGIIEYALYQGLNLEIEENKIRPPYHSDWVTIPTEEECESFQVENGSWDSYDPRWSQNRIYHSMMVDDFARYVIGTNHNWSEWLSLRLEEPPWRSSKEKLEAFIEALTPAEREAWDAFQSSRGALEDQTTNLFENFTDEELRKLISELSQVGAEIPSEPEVEMPLLDPDKEHLWHEREVEVEEALSQFTSSLSPDKKQIFEDNILPYLKARSHGMDEPHFDLALAQRWILKRVFELGWTVERFGEFDRFEIGYDGRSAHKAERIGKKYQWIAYHEFLARLADNFQFREPFARAPQYTQYLGPWQIGARDIDPSCVLKSTERGDPWHPQRSWWAPINYDLWLKHSDDVQWMNDSSDLPEVKPLVEITHPMDGSKWFALNGYYRWEQPTPPDVESHTVSHREIWYILHAYLVRQPDMDELYAWAQEQDFMGRWMPEAGELYKVCLGEFFWSPAYEYFNEPYERTVGWQGGGMRARIPKPVMSLAEVYLKEDSDFDCSIDETYRITLPCQFMVEQMELQWNGVEGSYFDSNGKLIAFDPSVRATGPNQLLVERDAFLKFLREQNLSVFWTLIGEKQLIGGMSYDRNWKGRMSLTGAYRIQNGQVTGQTICKFQHPQNAQDA